jgi:uncharacterized protein (DUF697 family)/uncharacterized tellurite resistance protein B-like protein
MAISHSESVASLHVLVKVAQADRVLHSEEQKALQSALDALDLGEALDVRDIFGDDFDLDEQIALLESPAARDETYKSAYSMAYADGSCSEEERQLLASLREKLGVSEAREEELKKLFESGGEKPSYFSFVADPAEREKRVQSETQKCAIFSAILGAAPWPGLALATDLAVVYLQVCLVRDIGAMHGRQLDLKAARGLLAAVGVGTGARIAIANLAKLLPGWGSLVGATTSYASTVATGRVFHKYFAEGGEGDPASLKREFARAQAEGKKEYEANRAKLQAEEEAARAKLDGVEAAARASLSHAEIGERLSRS